MTIGSSFAGTFSAAGQIGLIVFEGTAGRKVSLTTSGSTVTGGVISINSPNGTTFAEIPISTSPSFLDATTLPVSGTYTLFVTSYGGSSGSLTLNLYDTADFQGTITPGGPSVTVTTVPAQNAGLTFSGTVAQQVGINLTNGSYSSCNLTLNGPDGSTLASGTCSGPTNNVSPVTLGANGTYKIFIDPQGAAAGSVTVQATSVLPVTATITPGGSPVTVTTTQAGQDAVLTFSSTAGQRVSLAVTSVTNPGAYVRLVMLDGTDQTYIGIGTGCNPCFLDTLTLATAGTYTLWVQHYSTNVGSETLQLYNVVDATGTVTVGGVATTVTISTPGQNAQLTFGGTSGQQVTVHITNNVIGTMTVNLLDPSGNTLTSTYTSGSSFDLATQTLSTTGTYTISIDPYGASTGTVSVNVTSP